MRLEFRCCAIAETGTSLDEWCRLLNNGAPIRWPGKITKDGNPDGPLFGEHVAFTGKLTIARARAAELAANAGCKVGDVTKDTTILVIGSQDPSVLNGKNASSKMLKAMEYIRLGQKIRIINEADFFGLINPQI